MSVTCLTCQSKSIQSKKWQKFFVNECSDCSFCWIEFDFQDDDSVSGSDSSITTESFYTQALAEHNLREQRFKKIVRNRISAYSNFLNKPVESVLEVGCGSGACKKGFQENNVDWYGTELNNQMYDFCLKFDIDVYLGDFINFDFDRSYDVIYASQVLEHINNPNEFIEKCKKVLNPGGIIHVDVPHHESFVSKIRKFSRSPTDYGAIRPFEHMRAYSKKSLSALFSAHNLEVIMTADFANDDKTFGQLVINIPLAKKIIFFISKLLRKQSLLVGIARLHN